MLCRWHFTQLSQCLDIPPDLKLEALLNVMLVLANNSLQVAIVLQVDLRELELAIRHRISHVQGEGECAHFVVGTQQTFTARIKTIEIAIGNKYI